MLYLCLTIILILAISGVRVKSLQSCQTLCDAIDYSPTGFSTMVVNRQEYWRRLPCPPPGDLPNPGTEPVSLTSPDLAGCLYR